MSDLLSSVEEARWVESGTPPKLTGSGRGAPCPEVIHTDAPEIWQRPCTNQSSPSYRAHYVFKVSAYPVSPILSSQQSSEFSEGREQVTLYQEGNWVLEKQHDHPQDPTAKNK